MPDLASATSTTLAARFAAFCQLHEPGLAVALTHIAAPAFEAVDGSSETIRAAGDQVTEVIHGHALFRDPPSAQGLSWTAPLGPAEPDLVEPPHEAATAMLARQLELFFEAEAVRASFTPEDKLGFLKGMMLTRYTDRVALDFFLNTRVTYDGQHFPGKGFRSLGQEAICAAAFPCRVGDAYRGVHSEPKEWQGDWVAPLIRDLGLALAWGAPPEMPLAGQLGKSHPAAGMAPSVDFHYGDERFGLLKVMSHLAIGPSVLTGVAEAIRRKAEQEAEPGAPPRSMSVCLAPTGEGCTNLGEWHECVNYAGVRRLPVLYIVEDNHTALSVPRDRQSRASRFALRGLGYGIPGVTIPGNDPELIASFSAAAVRQLRRGDGPVLLELIQFRLCGHAHHDDQLWGLKRPLASTRAEHYAPRPGDLGEPGYADLETYRRYLEVEPLTRYVNQLQAESVIDAAGVDRLWAEVEARVDEAAEGIVTAPWPDPALAAHPVYEDRPAAPRVVETLAITATPADSTPLVLEPVPHHPSGNSGHPGDGQMMLEAIERALGEITANDPRAFVFGQDVGPQCGGALFLFPKTARERPEQFVNTPLSEAATAAIAAGTALAGMRPIPEAAQFGDFIATAGFNLWVNWIAKAHFKSRLELPILARLPWGGLRNAGPAHSQNVEAWLARIPGLRIVCPSTPADAYRLLWAGYRCPDPVLVLEPISLYREGRIRQPLPEAPPEEADTLELLQQGVRRLAGDRLTLVSYGGMLRRVLDVFSPEDSDREEVRVAQQVVRDAGALGAVDVIDLRTIAPLSVDGVLASLRVSGKLLVVVEDTRTGSVGQWLAAEVAERGFPLLDAPPRLLASLETMVPYAPNLEERFLVSHTEIAAAVADLLAY